ncbi:MAG: S41 family peptidase [Dehalococcoidales bacterium]|nr:S41 family peptidase [Dehalococcoidales bacterium]
MPNFLKFILIALLLVTSLALSFGAGCTLNDNTSTNLDPELENIAEAWDLILNNYVDRDNFDTSALSQAAIEGMLEALDDPYSTYLNAEDYQMSLSNLQGKFEGIGAYVGIEDEQIIIIAPIMDSPAAKAGIKAGDIIQEINGETTSGLSIQEAVLHIRGPKGTTVRLLILHQNESDPVEIEIIRAEIEVPSIYFEMIEDLAYINITHFAEHTSEELSPVLKSLDQEAAAGIILDLRSNPGGFLHTVIDVTSHFIDKGIIVDVVDNEGNHTTSEVNSKIDTTDLPMVILVDNYSASASEILTGALQDHNRATIAGTTTYGKGSVNVFYELKDGSGLYLTTARWLTPNGRPIEGVGIEPDYILNLETEDAIQWAIDYLQNKE